MLKPSRYFGSIGTLCPTAIMFWEFWDAVPDCYYAVYRNNGDGNVATLVKITYDTEVEVPENGNYFVTALTRGLNAESMISKVVTCGEGTSGIPDITM